MPEVSLRGAEFHYEEAGAGEPLLLLHGGLGTALLHFRREIEFFGRRFHVVAPDMRGYGQTDAPRDIRDYSQLQVAGDIVGLVHALGYEQAVIVGHDWGASAAANCGLTGTSASSLLMQSIF